MGFRDQVRRFPVYAKTTNNAVHVRASELFFDSVVNGSPVTGAPPLPVATGKLKGGVTLKHSGPTTAVISTSVPYSLAVEENVRGMKLTNGGPHGWALSRAGFDRLVAQAAAEVVQKGGAT